jgi:hypothetical protein
MNKRRLFTVLMVLTIFFGWQCGYEKIAPNELVGVWTTSEPKYIDRFIKIGNDTITFGTGGENFESYSIRKIHRKKVPKESSILYTIHYKNGEGVWFKFAFYYSPVNGGVIMLKNQRQIVWAKEQSDR